MIVLATTELAKVMGKNLFFSINIIHVLNFGPTMHALKSLV